MPYSINPITDKPPAAGGIPRKRYALSLPLALAARVEALREMHPKQTRAKLLADLLALGLAQVEQAAGPGVADAPVFGGRQPIYLLTGPFSEFHHLVAKHHLAMERAHDPDDSVETPAIDAYALVDGQ